MVTAVWTKSLPEAAARIRTEVFVQEQGFERNLTKRIGTLTISFC